MESITPMIRVPDVRSTVEWYQALGFQVADVHEEHGDVDWALVVLGNGRVMFNAGGRSSPEDRREVDLYVHANGIDALFERMPSQVAVVEEPHDTFYGMREFIIRDVNGFWITFGQSNDSASE